MKALVAPERGRLELREVPGPEPGPYDALVRIEVCGICNSTDLKLIDGTMFWAPPFPFIIGHESVGVVEKVGSEVRKFKPGDRVTRPVAFESESKGGLNLAAGGMAEFGVVRDAGSRDDYLAARQNVAPKELSADEASLAICLSETASVLGHLPDLKGKRVVVAGTGVAGLSFVLWAKMAGGVVVVLGRRRERLELASRLGADAVVDTTAGDWPEQVKRAAGGAADGAIEATGDAGLAGRILDTLKPDAFAAAYGVPPTGVKYPARWKEAAVEEHVRFTWVADLIKEGSVKPELFITHTWPLDDAVAAFAQVGRGEVVKGILRMGGK